MPSRSVACVLVSTLLLLLLATTAAAASSGDAASAGNVTEIVTGGGGNNSSATAPADGNGPDSYTCYVCAGRNLMMMKWCPIYWDECHLNCGSDVAASSSATTTSPVPHAGRGLVSAVLPTGTLGDAGDDDECYVMKLYDGNRYVIVQILKCGEVKFCFLTCGGGEVQGAGNALPAASAALPAAASQRPRLADADFQRCGDQAAMAWARGAVHRGA
ncbi:hypothetical protein EJB05_57298, partial [Eragrostis curvula]